MSRLAKKPIPIEPGVTASLAGDVLFLKGPKGEKSLKVLPFVEIKIQDGQIQVQSKTSQTLKQARANLGTMWSLIRNAVIGVSHEFTKILEIEGIGYRANLEGQALVLSLGFVNLVRYLPPDGISITVKKNTITISGIDKEQVGQAAAKIRSFKKPEPYKGKGIRYQGEVIRRKAGKKAVASS